MPTQKGTHVTLMDAKPSGIIDARKHGGFIKYYGDSFELADTADADNAIVLKLPIDGILDDVIFGCDDLGTAGTVDIGFYRKLSDGTYTAVDADALANNIDVNTAAVAPTSYRYSVKGIETQNQTLWELAGLSARPAYDDIYLSLTTDTGTTTAGSVLLKAYVVV